MTKTHRLPPRGRTRSSHRHAGNRPFLRPANQICPSGGIRTNQEETQPIRSSSVRCSGIEGGIEMTEKVEPEAQATDEAPPAPAEEQQQPKPEQEKGVEPEASREKKPRTPRARKPRQQKAAAHPPYFQMIEEAILALNEKNGSSPYAIAKFMEENHKPVLPANFRKILTLQIKNSVSRGKLTKVRASYKIPESGKKETNEGERAGVAKTRSTSKAEAEKKPKTTSTKKKAPGVKKAGKSGAGAAVRPKQPRSIKSAGPKRMKAVSAA